MEKEGFTKASEWVSLQKANKVGIIVAALVMLWGICFWGYLHKPTPIPEPETRTFKTSKPQRDIFGNVVGIEEKTITAKVTTVEQKSDIPVNTMGVLTFVGSGLFLVVRSFRPELGFWQGFWTLLGGCIVSAMSLVFIYVIFITRSRVNPGSIAGLLLMLALGGILLRNGFKPKKDRLSLG